MINKLKVILITIVIITAIPCAISTEQELYKMNNYIVKTSNLPINELWTIEQAEAVLDKAYQIGIPRVKDEQALLELVMQAYQWDKNAMLQYAKILQNEREIVPDKETSLATFLTKYSYELVDKQGRPLETPIILDLSYNELIETLANRQYAVPSSYMASLLMGTPEASNNKMISYIENSINGGYKHYDFLADTILFKTGYSFKDDNLTQLFTLKEYESTLSEDGVLKALKNYNICAVHGSQYCMVRLSESNFYGVGTNQDYKLAYAWSELANQSYLKLIKNSNSKLDMIDQEIQSTINSYNCELFNQIKENLNNEEIEQANKLAEELKQTIVTWDYDKWSNDVTIPIQP